MSDANTPPTLPTVVVDEAGDSPNWVPALGFALFALVAIVFAVQLAWQDAHPAATAAPEAPVAAPTVAAAPAAAP
jgi:hypothetical protein